MTPKDYIKLFTSDWTFLALMVGVLFGVGSIWNEWMALPFFILTFTAFDAFGYDHLFASADGQEEERLPAYRAMQATFHVLIMWIVYFHAGVWAVIACLIVWWFTFCDLLFYVLLRQRIPEKLSWLQWSVFFFTPWKKSVPRILFLIVSIFGLIISSIILEVT